jgi:hypothetical protein
MPYILYYNMNQLKVFVQGHTDEQLSAIDDAPHLIKINLNNLPLGKFQDNRLAEHRLFLSDVPSNTDAEYLGFATWRWNKKWYPVLQLKDLNKIPLSPDVVYYGMYGDENWASLSVAWHPGMEKYLFEISKYTNLNIAKPTFWANNFICHKSVYEKWQTFFRDVFLYLYNKYGYEYDFKAEKDEHRKPSILYERISMLYFANQPELQFMSVPFIPNHANFYQSRTISNKTRSLEIDPY